jgi:SAM-dependent methyltransferase
VPNQRTVPEFYSSQVDRDEQHNQEYFDAHLHEYSSKRIKGVAREIERLLGNASAISICDVGSGTGSNLQKLKDQLTTSRCVAFDISEKSLARISERYPGIETRQLSILDETEIKNYAEIFDVVVLAAVLHHLVGATPKSSSIHAQEGLQNALSLVKPGGLLVVLEPVFSPPIAMRVLFYIKKLLTSISNKRIAIAGYWNNIGAPLVMMYSESEVRLMISTLKPATLVSSLHTKGRLGWVRFIINKQDVAFFIEKDKVRM